MCLLYSGGGEAVGAICLASLSRWVKPNLMICAVKFRAYWDWVVTDDAGFKVPCAYTFCGNHTTDFQAHMLACNRILRTSIANQLVSAHLGSTAVSRSDRAAAALPLTTSSASMDTGPWGP